MSRLVSNQATGRALLNAEEAPPLKARAEDYLERVAKYVPAEILAVYLIVRGNMPPFGEPGSVPAWVHFALYGALVALTPFYFWMTGGNVPRKRAQMGIATTSFVIWSYGIGGPFFFKPLEHVLNTQLEYQGLAGCVVAVWALSAALLLKP
jgi:hypothetical protein